MLNFISTLIHFPFSHLNISIKVMPVSLNDLPDVMFLPPGYLTKERYIPVEFLII